MSSNTLEKTLTEVLGALERTVEVQENREVTVNVRLQRAPGGKESP